MNPRMGSAREPIPAVAEPGSSLRGRRGRADAQASHLDACGATTCVSHRSCASETEGGLRLWRVGRSCKVRGESAPVKRLASEAALPRLSDQHTVDNGNKRPRPRGNPVTSTKVRNVYAMRPHVLTKAAGRDLGGLVVAFASSERGTPRVREAVTLTLSRSSCRSARTVPPRPQDSRGECDMDRAPAAALVRRTRSVAHRP